MFGVYFVSKTVQVRLKSGRGQALAFGVAALAPRSVFAVPVAVRHSVGAQVGFESRVTRCDMVMMSTR